MTPEGPNCNPPNTEIEPCVKAQTDFTKNMKHTPVAPDGGHGPIVRVVCRYFLQFWSCTSNLINFNHMI